MSQGGTITPVLQADGTSVILNLGTPITVNTSVALTATVKGIVEASDSTVLSPLYTQVVTVLDTVAPTVTSVTSSTNGATATTATIKFSEPLASIPAVKIDGVTVSAGITAAPDAITGVTILSLTGLSLDATKSHTLQVVNATDYATNVNAVSNTTFSVTTDTVAPQVASVAQYADDTLIVKFDKDINSATVATNIAVADSNLTPITGFTVVTDPVDAKTFEVKGLTPLYASANTANLTVLFKAGILDSVGNALTPVTKSVTLNKDTVAPNVTGIVVNKNAAGDTTGLTVSFDSKLDNTFAPDTTQITVVNSNGVIDTTTFAGLVAGPVAYGDTSVTLNFSTPQTIAGKYGFTFGKTFEKDLSIAKNASNLYSQTIDFGSATTSTTWPLAATPALIAAAIDSTSTPGTIVVTFPTPVKGGAVTGSATDPNNYTLNGSTLPSGTVITLNSVGTPQTIATIVLPTSSIAVSDTAAVFTIKNIQRISDSLPMATATTTIATVDNTPPVLLSAKVLDNADIILTYNEAMKTSSAVPAGTDFTIAQNGTTLPLTSLSDATVTSVPGYSNELQLHIAKTTSVAEVLPASVTTDGGLTFSFGAGTGATLNGAKFILGTIADGTATTATYSAGTNTFTINGDFDNTTTTGMALLSDIQTAVRGAAGAPAGAAFITVTGPVVEFTGTPTASAAVTGGVTGTTTPVTLNLTSTITISANSGSTVVKDASASGNIQAATATAITVTK